MTGPGCRSKEHDAAENHPTPSPASPRLLTLFLAASRPLRLALRPPPQPATSNQQPATTLLACFCLSPRCRLPTMCEVQIWASLRRPVRKSWPTAQWKTSRLPGIWEHEVVNQPGARSEESKHTLHSLPSAQSARGSSSSSSSSLYCD
jgi:hypothetical protein